MTYLGGLTALALGLSLTLAGTAGAAEPSGIDTSASPEIIAPRPLETHVATPQEPTETVHVLLELLIDDTGAVLEVRGIDGQQPYRAAAETAALKFRFEPARRLGRVISARIRFVVSFFPAEPLAPKPTARTGTRAPAATPRLPGEIEVKITALRPARTSGVITRAEAREIPGTFGDPLRAVESSTGVTPIFSGVPFFFVRGAPPGNVGFFLDGVRVPLLYHALLGPSVVHPGLIDHVELYRGAAPARFGRYAGAIVSAETREPLNRAGGEANVRAFDAGGLVETPFAGGRGSVLVGGRYSYTALLASLLSGAHLEYWDYQARASYRVGKNSKLSVLAFGAYDRYEANDAALQRGGGTQFHRVDARYDYRTARTQARLAFTSGYDRTGAPAGHLGDQMAASRSLVTHQVNDHLVVAVGHDFSLDEYSLNIDATAADSPDLSRLFPARRDLALGAFAELGWTPLPWLRVVPGTRADAYKVGSESKTAVDGRLTVSERPIRRLEVTQSLGYVHQPPNYVPQIPAAQVGTLRGGLQRALQASSGVAYEFPGELRTSATAYRVAFWDLIDPIGRDRDLSLDPASLDRRERASAQGIEFELRRPMTHRFGGFVSYTLSRSDRSSGSRESLAAFDRPHVLQAAMGLDLGYSWRAGLRVAYYSGIPGRDLSVDPARPFRGELRAPAFFRLDTRLERRWSIQGRGYWSLVLEMLNTTLSREVTSRDCMAGNCRNEYSGPVSIPSVGVEIYYY